MLFHGAFCGDSRTMSSCCMNLKLGIWMGGGGSWSFDKHFLESWRNFLKKIIVEMDVKEFNLGEPASWKVLKETCVLQW